MYESSAVMKAAASSQMRIVPDTELAIRQLASVLKNEAASEEDVISALRHWSRVVVEHRHQTQDAAPVGDRPRRLRQIDDVVQISTQAQAKLPRGQSSLP